MNGATLPPLRVVSHQFSEADLCAGHLVLDFINTAAGLNRDPRDWLDGYARVVDWAVLAGICDPDGRKKLLAAVVADPAAGEEALDRLRLLRAALYEMILPWGVGAEPPATSVAELQRWCRMGGRALGLHWLAGGALGTSIACGMDAIGAEVAFAAVDLLSRPADGRLGVCAGRNCGWVFLDTSKSRRRRWCDMRTCGNAAKANRHYRRRQSPAQLDRESKVGSKEP